MQTKQRLDRNFALIGFVFVFIIVWFYFVQDSLVYSDSWVSSLQRSYSHNGVKHLFRNCMSLILTTSFLFLFVTYRFFVTVIGVCTVSSMLYYQTYSEMVGFSVVTSGLMGSVVIIFLVNCYLLVSSNRVIKSQREYVEIGSSLIYLRDPISKVLFGYQVFIFLFSAVVRFGDLTMQLGLIPREYSVIPKSILHGTDGVEPFYIIEAHLFGFITGLIATTFLICWTFIFNRGEYEERLRAVFKSD